MTMDTGKIPRTSMDDLTRQDVDQLPGAVLLEFGASWCGHCQALRPTLDELLSQYPHVRHISIEDGPGRPLGRSFRVKLWPTFVFLRDGKVAHRIVRPSAHGLAQAFAHMSQQASAPANEAADDGQHAPNSKPKEIRA
jgi:thioredoxin 1